MQRGAQRAILAVAAVATAALCLAASSLGAGSAVDLVSEPNARTEAGYTAEHRAPAISRDGRYVAYVGSLGPTGEGVYLRDMAGGTTAVNIPQGASEFGIEFAAVAPSISGSGRFLAFSSEDPGLNHEDRNFVTTPAGDTFPVRDVFVYDRTTGITSLVSRATGNKGAPSDADSNDPSISADGRYVAFSTQATNFLPGIFGGLFVRDLRTDRTVRADGESLGKVFDPSISGLGRWVAFVAEHRLRGHGRVLEVAVRDMKRGRLAFASRADGRNGALADEDCHDPAISANGRFVAFASEADDLSPVDRDGVEDVFVRNLKTGRTVLVSRAKGKRGAAAGGDSSHPSISADGRYVAFESSASNLGPEGGAAPRVFVRDMRNGRLFLASGGAGGAANAPSTDPAISADGRFVAFDSRGSNLSPADALHASSIFRYRLP